MKELEEIAAAYRTIGQPCALATVVRVEGSSYRRPGARMLVDGSGHIVAGCVSGGCLEADAAEHARQVIASGEPRVLVYDTLGDGDELGELLLGVGTGCEGMIEILVERLEGDEPDAIALPLRLAQDGLGGTVATVYRRHRQPAAEHVIMPSGYMKIVHPSGAEIFYESVQPPPRVLLCGGGPDSLPIARLAREILGWRVTVADHRAAYADAARYPAGTQTVWSRPDALVGRVALDGRTAVVVMTHNYLLDRELIALAAQSAAFYVGVLGSRKRWHTLEADLRESGIDIRAMLGARLHAPVGLDIGASSPETIALSIAAEVQAALSHHAGGALRDAAAQERGAPAKEFADAPAYTIATPAAGRKGVKPRCLIPLVSD